MDGKEMTELRDLIEFLKANEVAEFDMEREDLKVRLKFAGASPAPTGAPHSGVDLAQLAQLMSSTQSASAPINAVAQTQAAVPAIPAPAASASQIDAAPDPLAGAHVVKSPIVGTFYDAPAPDAEPFVKIGDTVRSGQVLCIVEAMKLMNEIESDAAGEIIKVLASPGQPVEYGQPLFAIRK